MHLVRLFSRTPTADTFHLPINRLELAVGVSRIREPILVRQAASGCDHGGWQVHQWNKGAPKMKINTFGID
jgi:hypothetical protein